MILGCTSVVSVDLSISRNPSRCESLAETYKQVEGSFESTMKYCQRWLAC